MVNNPIRGLALLGCLLAMWAGGCAQPAGVVFEPLAQPVVWPVGNEPPRVKYVGQLSTSADLKAAVPFGKGLVNAIFGKPPVFSMLTPYALCTDQGDRLFVADSNGQFVHLFDLNTRTYLQLRPGNVEKRFAQPVGLAYDPSGRLFVADSVAGRIYTFAGDGKYLGEIAAGTVTRPCGLAFDARNNRLFVADAGAHQIVVLSPAGEVLSRLGERGTELGQFNYPTNVAVDRQGRLYVSDSLNFRVQQFTPELAPIRQIGRKGDLPGYFSQPKGLALDSQDHLYVVDANFEAVQIFDSNGVLLMDFGQEGRGPGEFWLPAGIFIDVHDRIWIADAYNRRVQVFDYVPEKQP